MATHKCEFCPHLVLHVRVVRLRNNLRAPPPWLRPIAPLGTHVGQLCEQHDAILKAAGRRGRVHAGTGIRWWLCGDVGEKEA
jgi:hypothetical protein